MGWILQNFSVLLYCRNYPDPRTHTHTPGWTNRQSRTLNRGRGRKSRGNDAAIFPHSTNSFVAVSVSILLCSSVSLVTPSILSSTLVCVCRAPAVSQNITWVAATILYWSVPCLWITRSLVQNCLCVSLDWRDDVHFQSLYWVGAVVAVFVCVCGASGLCVCMCWGGVCVWLGGYICAVHVSLCMWVCVLVQVWVWVVYCMFVCVWPHWDSRFVR